MELEKEIKDLKSLILDTVEILSDDKNDRIDEVLKILGCED